MVNYAELATEHNKKVNTLAGQLEKINEMLGITKASAKIAIVDDNRIAHYMDEYLTDEQQQSIVGMVTSAINAIQVMRETEFNKLIGVQKQEKEEPVKEETLKEEVKDKVKDKMKESVCRNIDVEKFTKMYETGADVKTISNEFDITVSTVYGYASKLGIKRRTVETEKGKEIHVELTKELVRSKYTLTDTPIEAVAKELGVSKSELHEFVTKNGLKRVSKRDQKIFRDTQIEKNRNTPS